MDYLTKESGEYIKKQAMPANKKGFTLIELLVVIAIIGLLSTLAVVALGSARQSARDSKRLSDMKQVQTALELYYTDKSAYPTQAESATLGEGGFACLNGSGFAALGCSNPYMGLIPKDPQKNQAYLYISADGSTYTIAATLEGSIGGLNAGAIKVEPSGIMNQ